MTNIVKRYADVCEEPNEKYVLYSDYEKLNILCEDLRKRIRDTYEVYAGMEGFIPETAPEGYLLRIIGQMANELKWD